MPRSYVAKLRSQDATVPRKIALLGIASVFAGVPLAVAASSPRHALSVAVTGKGRVTSSPAGVSCPGECRARFAHNARVRLTARTAAGWELGRWSGACTGGARCALQLTASATYSSAGSADASELPD